VLDIGQGLAPTATGAVCQDAPWLRGPSLKKLVFILKKSLWDPSEHTEKHTWLDI
jgi:hypothetical protein